MFLVRSFLNSLFLLPNAAIVVLLLLIVSGTASASSGRYDSLETYFVRNFKGTWVDSSGSAAIIERWRETPDFNYLMQGITYIVRGKDTVLFETMEFEHDENMTFGLNISVSDQNEGRAVFFQLKSFTPNSFVFENQIHDFPTIIKYWFEGDTMYAEIEGEINGVHKSQRFEYKRVRANEAH